MAPHFLTRMNILKNRRNSSNLPRKLHGLKHINKTFKKVKLSKIYLPSLCTETLGFNHSSHYIYKPSYSNFKKLSFWRIGPIRYYNHRYGIAPPPPYVLGPIGLRLAVADLAGVHAAPPPPHFSHNFERKKSR